MAIDILKITSALQKKKKVILTFYLIMDKIKLQIWL